MDHSGNNSGSMQSSSGGDDQEYDSRNEPISPLFSSSFGSISNNPYAQSPPSLSNHQSHPPPQAATLFDQQLQAHNLHPFSHSPSNLDLVWSRSEPNYSNLGNLTAISSSSFPPSTQSQLAFTNQARNQGPMQSVDGNSPRTLAPDSVSDDHKQSNVGKNSRKRTRASRRAPTTVLTTDPSNFRQMVQEFTGIPAPPFSSSPYYSRRFDLFGGGGSTLRSGHLDTLGPLYSFRPSVQKVQQNPFVSSSSSSSNPSTLLNTIASNGNTDANTYTNNYPMNMQNPILTTFQSLLKSNGPHFAAKSQGSLGIPSMDELGMAQEHVNATNLTSELSMQLRSNNNINLTRSWREEEGANDQDQHLGSFDDGGLQNDPRNYKINGSGSGSGFRFEKGMENVSSRNEGTVDSWICPSD